MYSILLFYVYFVLFYVLLRRNELMNSPIINKINLATECALDHIVKGALCKCTIAYCYKMSQRRNHSYTCRFFSDKIHWNFVIFSLHFDSRAVVRWDYYFHIKADTSLSTTPTSVPLCRLLKQEEDDDVSMSVSEWVMNWSRRRIWQRSLVVWGNINRPQTRQCCLSVVCNECIFSLWFYSFSVSIR